jgi:hypothetical protein
MISCKKATFLITKKESDPIAFTEKFQLMIHLMLCRFCRLFEKQSKLIDSLAHHLHEHQHESLSEIKKEHILKQLQEQAE